MLFVSGQIPVNPQTGEMPQTIPEQAHQSLSNLKALVEKSGFTLANVIKTTVSLANMLTLLR